MDPTNAPPGKAAAANKKRSATATTSAQTLTDFQQAVDFSKSMFPNASSVKATFLRELNAAALSGRKATDAERVSEFCLAFCDIIRCGAERTISTNWPAVSIEHVVEFSKTVVLRLAPYATTAESVQNMFLCIAGCVAQGQTKDPLLSDRRNVFATTIMRDELFVPRAQYATSPCSVQWLLAALCCLMEPAAGALPRRAVFATPNVRDGIFATVARHASNISSNQRVFSAIHFLTCKSGSDEEVALRRDIFATESVRDAVFVTSTQFLLADG